MPWKAHKTTTNRKLITIQEWAAFFGISRKKVYGYLLQYQKAGGEYNPKDMYSMLRFQRYIILSSDVLKAV